MFGNILNKNISKLGLKVCILFIKFSSLFIAFRRPLMGITFQIVPSPAIQTDGRVYILYTLWTLNWYSGSRDKCPSSCLPCCKESCWYAHPHTDLMFTKQISGVTFRENKNESTGNKKKWEMSSTVWWGKGIVHTQVSIFSAHGNTPDRFFCQQE